MPRNGIKIPVRFEAVSRGVAAGASFEILEVLGSVLGRNFDEVCVSLTGAEN